MSTYERSPLGDIIIVKGITFQNTVIGMQEVDHAWINGRPSIIIYSDDEYDYFMTLTSSETDNIYEDRYLKIQEENILFQENSNDRYTMHKKYKKKNKNKSIKGAINISSIYKLPASGHDRIAKITYKTYTELINKTKEYYSEQNIESIINTSKKIGR